MTNPLRTLLWTLAVLLTLTVGTFAQDCRARTVTLEKGGTILSGKTGSCVKYRFVVESGSRAVVTLRSNDGQARFDLQDGAEDETGSVLYEDRTSLDKVMSFDEFTIELRGTAGAGFTLTVKVTSP